MPRSKTLIAAASAAALLLLPAAASATTGDRDHDRLPDRWERIHHLKVAKRDAARDIDRDGLSNLGEYRSGTDPRRADSDHDGITDGAEDRDHDGVDNDNEIAEGTSPRHADTDHDRRRDGDEDADRDGLDNEAEDAAGDDPRDRDTDGDGIEDGDEQSAVVVRSVAWVLRLKLAGGRSTSGRVDGDTTVTCSADRRGAASASGDGDGSDDSGTDAEPIEDDSLGDDVDTAADENGIDDTGDVIDLGEDDGLLASAASSRGARCDAAALRRGAAVLSVTGRLTPTGFLFTDVRITR